MEKTHIPAAMLSSTLDILFAPVFEPISRSQSKKLSVDRTLASLVKVPIAKVKLFPNWKSQAAFCRP